MKFRFVKFVVDEWKELSDDPGNWGDIRYIVPYLRLRLNGGWFDGHGLSVVEQEILKNEVEAKVS